MSESKHVLPQIKIGETVNASYCDWFLCEPGGSGFARHPGSLGHVPEKRRAERCHTHRIPVAADGIVEGSYLKCSKVENEAEAVTYDCET